MPQLLCQNLAVGYDGKTVVSGLNFEVCAGDYRACHPSVGETLRTPYAHQCYAYGGDGGPRRPRHHADEGADEAA